jgi:hypothetical protein
MAAYESPVRVVLQAFCGLNRVAAAFVKDLIFRSSLATKITTSQLYPCYVL